MYIKYIFPCKRHPIIQCPCLCLFLEEGHVLSVQLNLVRASEVCMQAATLLKGLTA